MGVSLKFSNIGTNINKILLPIMKNQNILRYIEYMDNDPLDTSKADIKKSLINSKIILTPFNNQVLETTGIFLFIYPLSGKLQQRPLGQHTFAIDIVCPLTSWTLIRNQFRPFEIADEISKEIDGQNVSGVGEVNITDYRLFKVDDNYSALSLFVNVNGSTLKERY